MITIIAAKSKNNIIGINNSIPWNLKEDMKRFKQLTIGKVVVMGRKTFDSIGRPLPNRTNIVLTRDVNTKIDGVLVYNNLYEFINLFQEIIIIGGYDIYKHFIKIADRIELTLIDKEFDGDTTFPEIDDSWEETNREKNNNGEFDYYFITYDRKHKNFKHI